MGQSEGGIYLVETPGDVAALVVDDENNLAYVTQTTLSVDDAASIIAALKARFPRIVGPKKDDICYATQNRQDAVKALAQQTRRRAGRGLTQQLELQPAARGRAECGRERLHGRQGGRPRSAVAGGQAAGWG